MWQGLVLEVDTGVNTFIRCKKENGSIIEVVTGINVFSPRSCCKCQCV